MKVGIVGGGMMGVSLGYFLSGQGVRVEVFEADDVLGGQVRPVVLPDGAVVDRFYHAVLSSDTHVRQLCTELGVADRLRFHETRMGVFHDGIVYPMNNVMDFMRFPPLGLTDRVRLGFTVFYAQLVRDWHRLEGISVEEWLVGLSGRQTYQNVWRPMLKGKFDCSFDQVPATYMWSRLVRMKSTRGGASQKEMAGHLIGGYFALVQAMADQIEETGGTMHVGTPVQEILIARGRTLGVRVGTETIVCDAVVGTVPPPLFRRLIPGANEHYQRSLGRTAYLDIISPLLVLDRPLTGCWTLNIADDRFPFTGVIETTTYIDPAYVGGHHLVYLPKYVSPDSPFQDMPDEEIKQLWLQNVEAMLPEFKRSWIRYFRVERQRCVEPLHRLNQTDAIPTTETPVRNLYLATASQIYPSLTNCESVTRHARKVAHTVIGDLLTSRFQSVKGRGRWDV
jgi:protoporphyrinogen oxidase